MVSIGQIGGQPFIQNSSNTSLTISLSQKKFINKSAPYCLQKKDKNLEDLLEIGLKRREEAPEIGELKF